MNTPATTQPSQTVPPPNRPSWKRRLRRAVVTLLVVLLVLAGVLYMLPIWACSEQGRIYALQQINRRLDGSLSVNNWRLGWFSGIRMEGVTLSDPHGRRVAECSVLQTDLTLWQWCWGEYDLGTTVVKNPRLDIQRYPDGSNDLSRILAGPPGRKRVWSLQAWLSSLRGAIQVSGGDLILRGTASEQPVHLSNLSAELPIASPTTTVHITVHATSVQADSSGSVFLEGNLPGLALWSSRPVALLRDVELSAHNLPTVALTEWLGLSAQWEQAVQSVAPPGLADLFGLTPAWEQAMGPTIDELAFENHPGPGTTLPLATLRLRSAKAEVDQTLLVTEGGGQLMFAVPQDARYRSRLKVGLGRPIVDLLGYVNPIFHEVTGKGTVELSLTDGQITLPLICNDPALGPARPLALSASGLVQFTDLQINPNGVLHQAWGLAGNGTATASAPAPLSLQIPPTRLHLADGRIRYSALVVTIPGRPRTVFSGSVGLDGTLDLLMRVSNSLDTLGGTELQLPIHGTISRPIIDAPVAPH